MSKRSLLVALLLIVAIDAEARRRAVAAGGRWNVPRCEAVQGFPSISISVDGGRSVLEHEQPPAGLQTYTFGLAALHRPNALMAITGRTLLTTNDSGCTWEIDGRFTFPQSLYRFVDAGADGFWAWSPLAPELFLLGEHAEVKSQRAAPVLLPIALYADPRMPRQLAAADDQGNIWWSDDAAQTWTLHAVSPSRPPLYALEFSPRGRAHLVSSGLADGAFVSFDGGVTWTPSAGLETLNVFRFAFSPADPDVVWAITLDPTIKGAARRAIYRSADGGRTYQRVITASAEMPMTNGFTITPAPRDASLLYVALPGTTLHLIDAAGRQHWFAQLPHRDINAIVFSPASPDVLYFGLKVSDMTGE